MTALHKDNLNPENFLKNHRRGGGGVKIFMKKWGVVHIVGVVYGRG